VTTLVVVQPATCPGSDISICRKKSTYSHYDDMQWGIDFGFAGSKCRWLDIEYRSSELRPFSVKRLTDIPMRLRQLADV
jgi:hypothetical protein